MYIEPNAAMRAHAEHVALSVELCGAIESISWQNPHCECLPQLSISGSGGSTH